MARSKIGAAFGAGSQWQKARRDLYLTQRTMGDVAAAARGTVPLGKRLVRRRITRAFFGALRRW